MTEPVSLKIQLNGEPRTVSAATIADLLEELELSVKKIAVEQNLSIVPRSAFSEVALQDGDRIEIVQFVGGG